MKKLASFNLSNLLQLNTKTGLAFSIIFWIYLILRAIMIPFLHDEIMSYWYYINPGKYLPFLFNMDLNAANNHVLNSLLTAFFYKLFGFSPIVLRMANLLFVPIYCYFAYKIATSLKNKYLSLLFWFSLLFIHSIVEFMALSRGYGMSFALLLGCLWYLIKVVQYHKTKDYLFTIFYIVAAVSANLSLLITALIALGLLAISILTVTESIKAKLLKSVIVLAGILIIAFFAVYSFALQKAGALYYGTHDGFWMLTITSLMKALFDNQSYLLRFFIFSYFIIIVLLAIYIIYKQKSMKIFSNIALIFPVFLIGNIIAVLLLDYFFAVNFPEDRSGFYFYYFFIGSIFFLIDAVAENRNYKLLSWIVLPLILIPLHFTYASNLTHIAVYKEDRVPYRFYETIKHKSESMTEVATVGSYFGRTLVLGYQNYLYGGNVGKSHDTDYPSIIPDFLVVKRDQFEIWNLYYNAIDFDEISGYHLLERKNKLKRFPISEKKRISTNGIISDEYFNLLEGNLDTLLQTNLFFEYDMDIESTTAPFETWLVLSVSDSAGNNTAYEYIPLNWIKNEWKGKSKHYHNGQLLTNLPLTSTKYITYLWNIYKQPFSVSNASVSIKQLEKE